MLDRSYRIVGTTLDGKAIDSGRMTATEAHTMARIVIADAGGMTRILRYCGAAWREMARYTDGGQRPDTHRALVFTTPHTSPDRT